MKEVKVEEVCERIWKVTVRNRFYYISDDINQLYLFSGASDCKPTVTGIVLKQNGELFTETPFDYISKLSNLENKELIEKMKKEPKVGHKRRYRFFIWGIPIPINFQYKN